MKDIYYTLFGYACILVLCVSVALLVSQNDADSSGAAWQDHGYAITFQSKLPGGITVLANIYRAPTLSQRQIDSLLRVPVNTLPYDTVVTATDTIVYHVK